MPVAKVFGGGACPPCPPCPPGSASWKEVVSLDLTGLDSQAMSGTSTTTFNLAKSGVPYVDAVVSSNITSWDYQAGASGISYVAGSGLGYSQVAFDLTTKFSKTGATSLTFEDWEEPVCIMFQTTGISWGNVGSDLVVGFGEVDALTHLNTLSYAWRVNHDNVDNNYLVRRYLGGTSEANVLINEPYQTSITFAIIVHAGIITEMWTSPGGTSIPADPRTLTAGPFSAGYSSIANGSMPLALNSGFCPYYCVPRGGTPEPTSTLTAIKVLRWE